jgi:CRISPR-associated protein Csm5
MGDKTHFQVTITTLSPLHIGSGERLREGFDFIEHDGYLWVADQGVLMRVILDEAARELEDLAQAAEAITGMTLYELQEAGWLREEHFDLEKGLFRYQLEGRTSTTGKRGELHEQIKDVYGQPYLPGSSLKGALRSTLMRWLAEQDQQKPDIFRKKRRRRVRGQRIVTYDGRFAARDMEKRHFVPADVPDRRMPNYDLWRAVQAFDSEPVLTSMLALGRVVVFPTMAGEPFDVEVIPRNVTFTASIQVDEWLFRSPRAGKLRFGEDHLSWFTTQLRELVNREARARLIEEVKFFIALQERYEVRTTVAAFDQLADELNGLTDDEMMLQVGKGTGWRSKTLGRVLQERLSNEEFDQLVKDFNLGRKLWRKDGRIPLTRQLATAGNQVRAPMGWVKVKLEEIK